MSLVRKRFGYVAGMAAAATASVVLAASPAAAREYSKSTVASNGFATAAGHIVFETYGDRFRVCDNWSDSAGVVGYWKTGSGVVHSLYNGKGFATCEYANEQLAEDIYVSIKVCIRDNGNDVQGTCSSWRDVFNPSGETGP
ncbi:hypothetical protein ACWCPI_37220 [Streptomyces sp. NPDC001920]